MSVNRRIQHQTFVAVVQPHHNNTEGGYSVFCSKCGKKNESGSRYCDFCGVDMVGAVTAEHTATVTYAESTQTNEKKQRNKKKTAIIIAGTVLLLIIAIILIVNIAGSRLSGSWVSYDFVSSFSAPEGVQHIGLRVTYSFSGKSVTYTQTPVDWADKQKVSDTIRRGNYSIKGDKIEFVWRELEQAVPDVVANSRETNLPGLGVYRKKEKTDPDSDKTVMVFEYDPVNIREEDFVRTKNSIQIGDIWYYNDPSNVPMTPASTK